MSDVSLTIVFGVDTLEEVGEHLQQPLECDS
jgi:hypothetical protein